MPNIVPRVLKLFLIGLTTVGLSLIASSDRVLSIKRHGSTIIVEWPLSPGYELEESTNFSRPLIWKPVAVVPVVTESRSTVTAPLSPTGNSIYRLVTNRDFVDEPDSLYRDSNFDGIDGDWSRAVFVALAPFGSDSNPGTMSLPLASIAKAIQIANRAIPKKAVYVAQGTYQLTNHLELASGVSIYGQFDGTTNWSRAASQVTVLQGATTAILARELRAETHVEGFKIIAADAKVPGESSYGIRAIGGSGGLVVRHNVIQAGSGAEGKPGENGVDGSPGGNGAKGKKGDDHGYGGQGGLSPCGRNGGEGGRGGANGKSGYDGQPGVGWNGDYWGPGRPGSGRGSDEQSYKDGYAGADGSNGTNGIPRLKIGVVADGYYVPPNGADGQPGTDGNGGGGGGGAQASVGAWNSAGRANGGSGGGAGGCHGTPGQGGQGGGGSFAVLVSHGNATITDNVFISKNGGTGGVGGYGALGGAGGAPGQRLDRAGKGASGGKGGAAGSGSGGPGGPSVGICYTPDSSVKIERNQYVLGTGGSGGEGGNNTVVGSGAKGLPGESRTVLTP